MEYKKITSPSNPHIKELVAIRDRAVKSGRHLCLIEGIHLIESALKSGLKVPELLVTSEFLSSSRPSMDALLSSEKVGRVLEISGPVLSKLSETESPQGVIALIEGARQSLEDLRLDENSIISVLEEIQDPGNLGSIIRSSDAVGATAVILLPGSCDPFLPKVVRSTAGSIFNLPVVKTETAPFLEWARREKVRLAATGPHYRETIFNLGTGGPLALVFGNEARGIGAVIERAAEIAVRVPIYGRAESLNVGAAAAVCLYEAARLRRPQVVY